MSPYTGNTISTHSIFNMKANFNTIYQEQWNQRIFTQVREGSDINHKTF